MSSVLEPGILGKLIKRLRALVPDVLIATALMFLLSSAPAILGWLGLNQDSRGLLVRSEWMHYSLNEFGVRDQGVLILQLLNNTDQPISLGDGEVPSDKTLRESLHWVASSWPYPRSREELEALPSPRVFKSHMPASMALGGDPSAAPCKHVYIARNPKDVCLSYFHFETGKAWSGKFQPPWERWLEFFLDGRIQRGSWFDHVRGWWELRGSPNIHFLTYEGLLDDPVGEIERLAVFLGRPISAELAAAIRERTQFDNMKSNSFSNLGEIAELGDFFRKGKVGSWREQFTAEQSEAFDRAVAERLGSSGPTFRYE